MDVFTENESITENNKQEIDKLDDEDTNKLVETEVPKSKPDYDKEEYKYLRNPGFSSEIFKIEVRNLPKYYGFGEIKKLINSTLGLECNKIKIPRKNSSFGFICMKNDEGEDERW